MISTRPSRGPSPLFPQLLPALLLACFATILFWWNPFGHPPDHAYFEAFIRPSLAAQSGFLADIDGTGLHIEKTIFLDTKPGEINHLRFQIPAGKLCAYVFTPMAAKGDVDVIRCQLTSESGEVLATMPTAGIAAAPGATVLPDNGGVRIQGKVGESLTGINHTLHPPLELAITPPPEPWQVILVFVGTIAASFALIRFTKALPWRSWTSAFWHTVHAHPRRAIFLAGLFSATLSCFPVIFCGMSFISPDNGMQTLYEAFPGVPGAQGGRIENPTGSDMGATMYWHMPASMIQHRAIFDDHEFPYWNRYNWGGVSLWAQCISMLGDPLHWPAVVTGGAAWAWDLKFILAKIFFAFGVGLLVWCTSRSLRASLLLALSAPYIGFFAYRFCHAGFFALCYAPWVLLPWVEAIRQPRLRQVAGWGALLMFANWEQLNSGTAKESSAFLVFLNGAGALALLGAPLSWRDRLARLGVFVWASTLFFLLSAPLWLPFLDALGKAATYYDPPKVCQIQPSLFIGAFDDIFYRQLMTLEFLTNPSANFFILLGAAWSIACCRSLARDTTFRACLIVAIAAIAIAFGAVPPDFLAQVPMIKNIYHFDNTFSCVLFILLFVLAGFGLRECHRRMRSTEWRGDWVIVLSIVGLLFGAFLGLTQAAHRSGKTFLVIGQTIPKSDFMWNYGTGLIVALAILPWAWRAVTLRRPAAILWSLVAISAFATLHFRHGMYLVTKFDLYTMNPKKRLDLRTVPSPAINKIKSEMREPARVVGLDWLMTPGFNTVLGLETISGPDALQNPAMRDLATTLGLPQMWFWKLAIWHRDFATTHRALDMLGVRYLLDKPGQGSTLPGTKLLDTSDLDVVESPTAWPRAFFTDTAAAYHDLDQIRKWVDEGDGRPFAALLPLAREALPLPARDLSRRTVVPAHDYRLTQNTTTFQVDAPSPGLAVLEEAWIPNDLEAFIDGKPADVLRVNHAFRGVYLDQPGHHTILFRYRPAVMDLALGIAWIGLGATGLTLWLLLRRPPRQNGTVPAKTTVQEGLTTP
jgi:hypothetical protein